MQDPVTGLGHLHEEEARYANKHGFSKHKPALPLYTLEDAQNCLPLFETVPYHRKFSPAGNINVRFSPAGHILGSSCVHLSDGERKVI